MLSGKLIVTLFGTLLSVFIPLIWKYRHFKRGNLCRLFEAVENNLLIDSIEKSDGISRLTNINRYVF